MLSTFHLGQKRTLPVWAKAGPRGARNLRNEQKGRSSPL